MIRTFISYAHESAAHAARVLSLAQRLRLDGVDCRFDAFINGHPEEGWLLWMEREIAASNYVLLVCTKTYLKRFMGEEEQATGLGVTWESQITRSSIYGSQGTHGKFIPIVFQRDDRTFIPEILRYHVTSYFLMDEYEKLLRFLTGQPRFVPVPVGEGVALPPDESIRDAGTNDSDLFAPSIKKHMATLERRVKGLTEEQVRVINQLRFLRRVRISGIAGSGKTLVAAEKAIRLANAGLKTLFLCHNPLLAAHVSALTSGSGVIVGAFTPWASALAGTASGTNIHWSKYDEPTHDTLALAFDQLFSSPDRYAAVIIDEGQDFRDEWWPLVEAALAEPSSGILYIFHDDRQALLPHRASYPFNEPIIDLSRNCRNAGRIYEIMRSLHPTAPESDRGLHELGDIFVEISRPGHERAAVRRAICWFPPAELERLTVLFAGSAAFTESIFDVLTLPVGKDVSWQDEVRRMFAQAQTGHTLVAPTVREIGDRLKQLSHDLRPSPVDIRLVQETASRFTVRPDVRREILNSPDRREGLVWQLIHEKARLRGKQRTNVFASEIVMHFEKKTWHVGLPKLGTLRFAREQKGPERTVPVYNVSEFKGLESASVLLYIHNLGSMPEEELLVGISRARLLLAIVVQSQAENSIPPSIRGLLRRFERDRSHADGQPA